MILRSSLRHKHEICKVAGLVLSHSQPQFKSSVQQCRQLHRVPIIGQFDETFHKEGVPGLFTAGGFDFAWTKYQTYLVDELNTRIANDTSLAEVNDPKTIALATALDPGKAATFNYASMAHNNHFFFQCLAKEETQIPPELATDLINSFGSISTLRDDLLTTAEAMFGPGFVWLVEDHRPPPKEFAIAPVPGFGGPKTPKQFRILPTYLAGSPYPAAYNRQQPVDMTTRRLAYSSPDERRRMSTVQNSAGSFGASSGMESISMAPSTVFGGATITPVLCVNTWPQVWLRDYGVTDKRTYLEQWWTRINWPQVLAHSQNSRNTYATHEGRRFRF